MYQTVNSRPGGLIRNSDKDLVVGNQEDIDLLIAFEKQAKTHLVLVEAKGGTAWGNDQLRSKASRLQHIFAKGRLGVIVKVSQTPKPAIFASMQYRRHGSRHIVSADHDADFPLIWLATIYRVRHGAAPSCARNGAYE